MRENIAPKLQLVYTKKQYTISFSEEVIQTLSKWTSFVSNNEFVGNVFYNETETGFHIVEAYIYHVASDASRMSFREVDLPPDIYSRYARSGGQKMGMIHSHCFAGVTFSGEDDAMMARETTYDYQLYESGFLSVIVNNEGAVSFKRGIPKTRVTQIEGYAEVRDRVIVVDQGVSTWREITAMPEEIAQVYAKRNPVKVSTQQTIPYSDFEYGFDSQGFYPEIKSTVKRGDPNSIEDLLIDYIDPYAKTLEEACQNTSSDTETGFVRYVQSLHGVELGSEQLLEARKLMQKYLTKSEFRKWKS